MRIADGLHSPISHPALNRSRPRGMRERLTMTVDDVLRRTAEERARAGVFAAREPLSDDDSQDGGACFLRGSIGTFFPILGRLTVWSARSPAKSGGTIAAAPRSPNRG